MSPEDLKSDNHCLLNAFFSSLKVGAFFMRGEQRACVMGKIRLDCKASYDLKLVTETTKS